MGMRRIAVILAALTLANVIALAHEEEADLDARTLVAQGIAYLQLEPPNLEMALDKLNDALQAGDMTGIDPTVAALARDALAGGSLQAAEVLAAFSIGEDPDLNPRGPLVQVTLGPAVYAILAVGLVLVLLGGYGLGRSVSGRAGGR